MPGQRSLQRRHLEAVVAVAEHRSVHAASRALGMPQPGLSRLLSEAERLLGDTRLFERSSQGSRLAEQGERLVAQARFVLQGMQRLAELAGESRTEVRVGCIARAMHALMPLVLNRVHPERGAGAPVQVKLAEASSTELLESLVRAELDFAILRGVGGAQLGRGVEMEALYDEQTVIVCSSGHRIGSDRRVSLASLAAQEWILPRRPTGSRILFDAFCSSHGLAPIAPVIESRTFETSLALVEKTRFLAIVPEPIARRYARMGVVRIIRTREVLPPAPMMLAYAAAAMDDPVLRDLRTVIREAGREVQQQASGRTRKRTAR